jgi:hypothetical protein
LPDLTIALTPLLGVNAKERRSRDQEKNHTDNEEHDREESGGDPRGDKGDYTRTE